MHYAENCCWGQGYYLQKLPQERSEERLSRGWNTHKMLFHLNRKRVQMIWLYVGTIDVEPAHQYKDLWNCKEIRGERHASSTDPR